ncbi:MAG: hypothetical protein NTX64_12465 [Elusimicrobia bacterium]|nr:hypothetical protein [Elusimicrobiota bacterium]
MLCLAACAGPRPAHGPAPPSGPPPNLEVSLSEVIERADQDGLSYAKVFVDGQPAGQTDTGPRSHEKRWEGRVEPGNHPVRLELWVLRDLGDWTRLSDEDQPRERFVRVEGEGKARLELRRTASGRYDFTAGRTK